MCVKSRRCLAPGGIWWRRLNISGRENKITKPANCIKQTTFTVVYRNASILPEYHSISTTGLVYHLNCFNIFLFFFFFFNWKQISHNALHFVLLYTLLKFASHNLLYQRKKTKLFPYNKLFLHCKKNDSTKAFKSRNSHLRR